MALRYSVAMRSRQTLLHLKPPPRLWLVSDARNDAVLEAAIRRLPRGSGLVFRHYHLAPKARANRFSAVRRLCRARGIVAVLAGSAALARRLGADGSYGPPLPGISPGIGPGTGKRLATVHSLREIGAANRTGADMVLLSPVFATRSHPGGPGLGAVTFLLLARRSLVPVIALGGMNRISARRLPGFSWAAIDGLSPIGQPAA